MSQLRSLRLSIGVALIALMVGCGSDGGSAGDGGDAADLAALIAQTKSAGDPANGLRPVLPSTDPLVKLGQLLFFSKTLSGTFDSACASCHHPDMAGGDDLSLPVGVNAVNPDFLGPGRRVDHSRDFDPLRDGGPNVPRNSLTILNTALYQSALFFDGRVFLKTLEDGSSYIRTPDGGNGPDANAGTSLLAAQARFPVTSPDEMRNFFHTELVTGEQFRDLLVSRLRGEADEARLSNGGSLRWLGLFREAFGQPEADAQALINYPNIQAAIAAYQKSLTFVNTPWRKFTGGDVLALSEPAKVGARLFLASKEKGGLGCAACHSGSFFTDEKFHNVGFPQIGRGKRADGRDFGRWQVTRQEGDKFSFRTPSLINVMVGAPYGHAGTFQRLADVLRYHANPRRHVDTYDYSLRQLEQFSDGAKTYPNAGIYTREAVSSPNLSPLLLHRELSDAEVESLTAFLASLTDVCLASGVKSCLVPWVPDPMENPDGNMLVRSYLPLPIETGLGDSWGVPLPYPSMIDLTPTLESALSVFPDMTNCSSSPSVRINDGAFFRDVAVESGVVGSSRFDVSLWFSAFSYEFEDVAVAGGVTASYINDDCWPDLMYVTGSNGGIKAFANVSGQFSPLDVFPSSIGERVTSIGVADIDGDYRREIFVGNLMAGSVGVLRKNAAGGFNQIGWLPMARNTYGFAFGDYDKDGYIDVYMTHWDFGGLPGSAPALWRNFGGVALLPVDGLAGTAVFYGVNQNWQFSPSFVDADGDGWQDLLVASDFGSSLVMRNVSRLEFRFFEDVTNRSVITDENGMGSAIGDINNDGRPDWFVTSVYDPNGIAEANWGVTGNRLYRNSSYPGQVSFQDISLTAGITDGGWGWGACMADFDNDGWLDIFHVNGFGRASIEGRNQDESDFIAMSGILAKDFVMQPPRLFINNRNGTFTESASAWGIDEGIDGRGIACLDYDRDGDVDLAIFEHGGKLRLHENRHGILGGRNFISIRVAGKAPATEAIGAVIRVTADLNGDGVIGANERQVRTVAANSNYNSQNPADLHFGLGKAATITSIEIQWPNGAIDTYDGIQANQFKIFVQN